MEDGPVWDFAVSIRGVTLRLISPLELDADLPLVPVPDQAGVDRLTGRRPGVFVRLWRWLFGEPAAVRANELPADGGAAHTRDLCLAMYGVEHAAFLAGLTTGEIYQLVKHYMGCQDRWAQALYDYGVQCAEKSIAARTDQAAIAGQTAQDVHSVFATAFGPPARRYAPGLRDDADHADPTNNGAVKFPGTNGKAGAR